MVTQRDVCRRCIAVWISLPRPWKQSDTESQRLLKGREASMNCPMRASAKIGSAWFPEPRSKNFCSSLFLRMLGSHLMTERAISKASCTERPACTHKQKQQACDALDGRPHTAAQHMLTSNEV